MRYQITELIAEWDKNNHKKIVSKLVDRKNHFFNNLKDLAEFSRENYIFTSFQKEITDVPRDKATGEKLYIGNNLIWIDMDFDVNFLSLKKSLKELNVSCFAYYSSSHYSSKVSKARLCIICDRNLDLEDWTQVNFFANQILAKLKIEPKPDKAIYNLSSYMAFVKGDYEPNDLFVLEGNPYKWIKQDSFIEEFNKASSEKKARISKKSGFGKIGELAAFFKGLNSVECAVAHYNKTINLCFVQIHEKTALGYYIYANNPWILYHNSKDPMYLSNCLNSEDFEKFKEFFVDFNDEELDPFEGSLEVDETICDAFIGPKYFNKGELLFLESPTGTGKTTAISSFFVKNIKKSVLFISVNRMQAVALYRSLKKKVTVTCYLKDSLKKYQLEKKGRKKVSIYNEEFKSNAESGELPQRLICGVVSLHHLMKDGALLKKYDYVVIDEISTLPSSVSSPVGLVYERLGSFELGLKALKLLLTSAEKVICMDGFVSKTVVKLITDISEKEPYIIKNTLPTNKRLEIHVCSGGQPKFEGKGTCSKYLAKIMEDIDKASFGATKRLMIVALSSLDLSNTLGDFLRKKYPDKIIQVFNSELTERDGLLAIQMFEDLDKYLEEFKIDILIYSPTITTGIDIPQAKGTNVYQIISGDQLSSHTNYQMAMRGRQADSYRILIAKSLMLDKNQDIPFSEYISSSIDTVKNSIPFKSSRNIQWKSKSFSTTGMFLAYYRLEYNLKLEDWEKVCGVKTLISALNTISRENNYDLEGVKIGLKIDKALIEFQKELYLKGKNGFTQYLNFLKHEKCRISIEEDIDYNSPHHYGKYASNSKKYIANYVEDYTLKLKELCCWKEAYSTLKYRQLNEILKVAKIFHVLRGKIGVREYSNDRLLDLYDTLYKKSFLKEYKNFEEYFKKESKKEKIAFMKSMLSVVFKVRSSRGNLLILSKL